VRIAELRQALRAAGVDDVAYRLRGEPWDPAGPGPNHGGIALLRSGPAAALHLSDSLVSVLSSWAQSIKTLNRELQNRQDGKYDGEWQRLFHEGMGLAQRLARELGPARTVTYIGLVNGGLSTRTTMTWQGDKRIEGA
jgi:hypothetical protein